jgi:hypothetical protein
MTVDVPTALVAATFAAQVLTMSFVVPARFRRYFALLFERYPQREFPRLYPVPQEQMEQSIAMHKPIYVATGVAGLLVLGVGLSAGAEAVTLARLMTYYMLVQFMPLLSRLVWSMRVARAFRAMTPPPVRSAELRRTRVTEFVPPMAIVFGLLGSSSGLACAAFGYTRSASLAQVAFAVIVNGWLLGRMVYVLATPVTLGRVDPYMSEEDVFRARRQRLRLLFGGGGALGAYASFMLLYGAHVVRFDFAYLCAVASLLSQAVVLLAAARTLRTLEERDFSVYRSRDGIQPAGASS